MFDVTRSSKITIENQLEKCKEISCDNAVTCNMSIIDLTSSISWKLINIVHVHMHFNSYYITCQCVCKLMLNFTPHVIPICYFIKG